MRRGLSPSAPRSVGTNVNATGVSYPLDVTIYEARALRTVLSGFSSRVTRPGVRVERGLNGQAPDRLVDRRHLCRHVRRDGRDLPRGDARSHRPRGVRVQELPAGHAAGDGPGVRADHWLSRGRSV